MIHKLNHSTIYSTEFYKYDSIDNVDITEDCKGDLFSLQVTTTCSNEEGQIKIFDRIVLPKKAKWDYFISNEMEVNIIVYK